MTHHICGRQTDFEGNVLFLELEKHDPNRMKLSPLYRDIFVVSELVMPTGSTGKRARTAYGAIVEIFLGNEITLYHYVIRAVREIDCVYGCRWR